VTVATKRFEIEPVRGDALPEAATFLERWQPAPGRAPSTPPGRADSPRMLRSLQWMLLDNPLAATATDHGLCLRDASGLMVGLLLSFPTAFRAGDRRILALGSGSYFVEPRARTLGFYLFKRHLACPGYAFFFSTTCNADSGALWTTLGARAVPHSDVEYVLPLDLEVMLPAVLAGRTSSAWAAAVARAAGRWAEPLRRRTARTSTGASAEPCRDWEKLAELSRRHRAREWITSERSPAFLEWRYGPGSALPPSEICVFHDGRGHEGWFALGPTIRGPIHGRVLLDATWPRDTLSFADVLAAVTRGVAGDADAIYFRPRPGVDYDACGRFVFRRRREPPPVFAIPARDDVSLDVSSLDLVLADGDGGLAGGDSW